MTKVLAMAAVMLGATVFDGSAATVDLYVNGQFVGSTSGMSFTWDTKAVDPVTNLPRFRNGEHVLTAVYHDDQGRTLTSDSVRVKVYNPAAGGGIIGLRPPLIALNVGGTTRASLGASQEDASRALMIEGRRSSTQSLVLSNDVAEASIIDLKGRTVWQRRGDGTALIDGNLGPSGLYILAVRENSGDMHHFRVLVVR
jgi:hypothetical protein